MQKVANGGIPRGDSPNQIKPNQKWDLFLEQEQEQEQKQKQKQKQEQEQEQDLSLSEQHLKIHAKSTHLSTCL